MEHIYHTKALRKNKHMTYSDRLLMEVLHKEKKATKEISEAIGVSQRTIQREMRRGAVQLLEGSTWIYYITYSADVGQNLYNRLGQNKGPSLKIGNDHELCAHIEKQIIEGKQSPDVVIEGIKKGTKSFQTQLCTRTLYNYIDRGLFLAVNNQHLIYGKRKKKAKSLRNRPSYKNIKGRSIEERSTAANDRSERGHWEMDCVVGGKGKSLAVLLTLTERATRLERILKLKGKTQEEVVMALDGIERQLGRKEFKSQFKTITVDNGCEFLDYAGIERSNLRKKTARTILYYAHPYSSWERGSNENMNRMIRRFVPKGTDIGLLGKREIKRIQDWLNNYPRKILDYLTPQEAYLLAA